MTSLATERRAARERALGLLYEAETKGTTGAEVLSGLPVDADDFAVALVLAVDEHRSQIDELLERFAEGWSLERMAALDRAALRMGSAELLVRDDVPTAVVLAETVDLASRFSTDASGRFVNGLLAAVAREVRGRSEVADLVTEEPSGPPLTPQVGALVIDLDGVIRHWDTTYYPEAEAELGVPAGALIEVALDGDRLARVADGRLPFEDWCEEVGAELAARHGCDAAAASAAWAESRWRIDLSVMDLVAEARRNVPVVLLSNASTRLQHDLDRSGIGDAFDAVVGSADIRAAKPDRAAFEAAAAAAGVALESCLFVDDLDLNVQGARVVGMRAEVYTGVDELRHLLVELEVIR